MSNTTNCVVVMTPHQRPAHGFICPSLVNAAIDAFYALAEDEDEDALLEMFGIVDADLKAGTLREDQCCALLGYDYAAIDVWTASNVALLIQRTQVGDSYVRHGDPRRTNCALRLCWEAGLIAPASEGREYDDPRIDDLQTEWRVVFHADAQEVTP